jgi:two-component system, chemotaxis family, CheB/CheR fusion protein
LAEANDDMDNLLATTRVGVIFLDQTLSIRRYTPEIAKVFHIVPQDVGRSIRSFAHNLEYDNLIADLESILETRVEREVEVQDRNGNYFLVRMSFYQSVSHNPGVVVTLIDISARLAAERELHMRQLAIDAASNGILITDPRLPDNPITYINRGFAGMTGYTIEDSLGRNCRFLQGEKTDPATVQQVREAVAKGEDCRVTLMNYRKDGTEFWNHLQITAVHDSDGTLVNFVGVQHDITEQVVAKEQARESAERIRALLDSTAEGIYGLDSEGRCTFCNRACLEMLGYDRAEQLIGKDMHALVHHSCQAGKPLVKEDCLIYHAIRSGEKVNVDSDFFWRADDTCFPVEFWSHPIERDGRITGAVVTFVDTTQRRQHREELQLANEAANAANRAKSQFLANMSHELRTPMAVVMGFADILLEESDDPRVLERVSVIRRNGEYLLKLMNDILDLSRVEVGALKLEKNNCDLRDLLLDLRDMMQVRAAEVGRPIHFHFPPFLPNSITTDRARVRQVLVNLIGNAIKFSPNGRVDVTVDMSQLGDQPAIRFIVADNGIGMSEIQKQCIFQPFSQANETVAKAFGGTGLGLSISKRLIDSLGGTLEIDSTEGFGSTFIATFPADPTGPMLPFRLANSDNKSPVSSNLEKISLDAKVLLADDMRDVRYVARHFLEKAGASVTVVENGRDAVDVIQAAVDNDSTFDLAIIDMQMPEMSGLEAIEELRKRNIDIPAIALTADAMKGTRRRVLDAGFDEYLAKPITASALLRTSLNVIHRSRQSKRLEH